MCDGPASIIGPDLPSHVPFEVRVSETNGLQALGQCIPSLSKAAPKPRGTAISASIKADRGSGVVVLWFEDKS